MEHETSHDEKSNLRTIIQALMNGDKDWLHQQEIIWSDKGPYWVLNYRPGERNKYNRLTRGLIVQKPQPGFKGDILSLIKSFPFIRFYNQHEKEVDPVDLTDADMLEKMDGCFDKDTKISFCDGRKIRIKDVVEQKMDGPIWGYDHTTGQVVKTDILAWHDNGLTDEWVTVKIKDKNNGNGVKNIMCTPDHLFWTNNKYQSASKLDQRHHVSRIKDCLSHVQKSIVLGSLLGDVSIVNDGGICLAWSHVIDQDSLSKMICEALPLHAYSQLVIREDSFSKKPKRRYNIHGTEVLEPIYNLCVKDGKKHVSQEWLNEINEISLAVWYMDDGSLAKGSGNQRPRAMFHTEGFSKKEVNLIIKTFENNYGWTPSTDHYRGYYAIRLNANDAEQLWAMIAPYVLPYFDYKIPKNLRSNNKFWDLDNSKNFVFSKTLKTVPVITVETGNCRISAHATRTRKYDITTSTSNFFANDILVHNSMVGVFFPTGNKNDPQWHTRKMVNVHEPDMTMTVPGFHGKEYNLMGVIGEYVKNLKYTEAEVPYTLVFEFIHDASTVLTKYKENQYGLYLLGARHIGTHRELGERELDHVAAKIGANRPRRWDAIADQNEIHRMMKEIEKETPDFEGYVFRDRKTGKRMKVKDPDYVKTHHMLGDVSMKRLIQRVMEGEEEEILAYFPWVEPKINKIKKKYRQYLDYVSQAAVRWRDKAQNVGRQSVGIEMFGAKDGRKREKDDFARGIIMKQLDVDNAETIRDNIDQRLKELAVGTPKQRAVAAKQKAAMAAERGYIMLDPDDMPPVGNPQRLMELIGLKDDPDTRPDVGEI